MSISIKIYNLFNEQGLVEEIKFDLLSRALYNTT